MMRIIDLFAGIGVASLAADKVWGEVEHEMVEIDPFCQTILKKHFPKAKIHDDIRTYRAGTADLVWGSPPCQAASQAGSRKGDADERWLWPETFRVIREAVPRWWVLENVYGLLTLEGGLVFDDLLAEMENMGYEVRTFVIPACAIGAPHRRDRTWIIGHSASDRRTGEGTWCKAEKGLQPQPEPAGKLESGLERPDSNAPDPESKGLERGNPEGPGSSDGRITEQPIPYGWNNEGKPDWTVDWREVAFETCQATTPAGVLRVDDGPRKRLYRLADGTTISAARLRKERLKALGNSLVLPNVIEIFKAIKYADEQTRTQNHRTGRREPH